MDKEALDDGYTSRKLCFYSYRSQIDVVSRDYVVADLVSDAAMREEWAREID